MLRLTLAAVAAFSFPAVVAAQGQLASQAAKTPRLDVEHYVIEADINPGTQTLAATVQVRFIPSEEVSTAAFELNNALNVSKIVDGQGRQVPASRSQQDYSVRLSFPEPLPKGKPATLTFTYDGRLAGTEESPVYGIKFAAIKPDIAYLMYPARWFPVNDYSADRFSAELKISVPAGMRVLASGIESADRGGDKHVFTFQFRNPSFPGSIAVVKGEPSSVPSQGVTTAVYFRDANQAAAKTWGEETGKIMAFLTGIYGMPPQANLALVETEAGTPNAYSAPGILFVSSKSIAPDPSPRLLANQIARQWWGTLVSPVSRNHIWITNGLARYAELMYIEQSSGAGALETEIRDTFIEALTIDNPPVIQSARLEDYSPEFWAVTAGKGAAVLHMLRYIIGDDKFNQVLKNVASQNSWKPIGTADFRKAVEAEAGQNLEYFFIQWIESSGAPEFKIEYTVFRTQNGFRVMGKVAQDLDTFRMPVELRIETEGNPETKRIDVVGPATEFIVDTFGKPKKVTIDPNNRVLRYDNSIRLAVAVRRGEQFAEIGEFAEALREYQRALDVSRNSSLAHYRVAEVFFLQNNYQSAANEFRQALSGDLEPKWTEVWSRIHLGKIFDITNQRERAVNEYQLALRTKDNTQGAQEEAAKFIKAPYQRQAKPDGT